MLTTFSTYTSSKLSFTNFVLHQKPNFRQVFYSFGGMAPKETVFKPIFPRDSHSIGGMFPNESIFKSSSPLNVIHLEEYSPKKPLLVGRKPIDSGIEGECKFWVPKFCRGLTPQFCSFLGEWSGGSDS